jgi:hypothetical protein
LTWLCLGLVLWLVLFHPACTALLFSRRDDEATDLLATRLRGMYDRLPGWLKVRSFGVDNGHEWALSNGSRVLAFPTTAGDSYTATIAVVDEADLVPDLDRLLGAVKPTVDNGGKLVLLSRADKTRPESPFKRIYRAAKQGSGWAHLFLPWHAHPGRDRAWYEAQRRDCLARTGALDQLHEQYPNTDAEALAPASLDKRLAAEWLLACHVPQSSLARLPAAAPALPGLNVFHLPQPGRRYVAGADPAEGSPLSDESALCVLDDQTGEECASLAGRYEPSVLAAHLAAVCRWYNGAPAMVERNNHGHAVLLWLIDNARWLRLLPGHDGKPGWMSSTKGKALLYDGAADAFREGDCLVHDPETYHQLASIEGATLRAPQGQNDDRATAFALALAGRLVPRPRTFRPRAAGSRPSGVAPQPGGPYNGGGGHFFGG